MAESQGFEPWVSFTPHSISSAAPSTTRTTLHYTIKTLYHMVTKKSSIFEDFFVISYCKKNMNGDN